ncbi:MAG TPA: ADOP family duplicated permease [Gemmatimonadaceae bacterium]
MALLRALLPYAERDEVLADLAEEHAERARGHGRTAARIWLWRQVLGSTPALLRRSWWRGWSGFEPRANRMRPGGSSMESWIMDLRYAARRLRTRPTYALLAVVTLALGVGGTAAIFGLVRGLLLDPLPYAEEDRLTIFWNRFDWSEAEFAHLRPEWPGFEEVAMYRQEDLPIRRGDGSPRLVSAILSSAELFDVLGARPATGRGFRAGDDLLGAEPVVVLGHGLWRELGGDPAIVGSRIDIDGLTRTVVGVMPEGFWFPDPAVRAWVATPVRPENRVGNYALVGRRPPGQSAAQTAAALARITDELAASFQYSAQWDKTKNAELTPIRESLLGGVRLPLLATLGAMAVILLIACANVAALMLGQVEGRSTELAVRAALGAGRRRLVQQLVSEAMLVGGLAGILGALLAWRGIDLLAGALPLGALAEGARADWTIFGAAIVIALVASVVVALAPITFLRRGELQQRIGRARTAGIGGHGRIESGLVVAEVALAVLLAAGAGLLVRSVANLRAIDPGVDTRDVAVLDLVRSSDVAFEVRRRQTAELLTALEALPGVRSVAATQRLPLRGSGDSWGIEVEGRPDLERSATYYRVVSRDYFETLGISLLAGRAFDASDRADGEPVVVINEALVRKYFEDEDPLGRRIATGYGGWARVVGVVEDVAEANLTDEPAPARYMSYEQVPYWPADFTVVVRADRSRDAAAVLDEARGVVTRIAPDVAVHAATTMGAVFAQALGPARQVMALLALLTGLALVLGAIGIYGVISQFVTRRRRDWSIRLAMGLTPGGVVRQVVSRGTLLVLAGAAVGLVGVVALTRLLSALLYGVEATDPATIVGAVLVLLAVGVAAAYVPAWRASRLDPATALREQ